jgi:hypothetical protein
VISFNELNTATINLNGTVNLSAGIELCGGNLKYIGGTANIAVLYIYSNLISNIILDISGITLPIIDFSSTVNRTIQLDSQLNSTSLILDGILSFIGNFGYVTSSLTILILTPPIITYKSGNEYIVNDTININGATFLASTIGVKAKFTLGQNINQICIATITATDIDSSNGRRINNFYGTATNCDNWRVWNDNTLPQASSTF